MIGFIKDRNTFQTLDMMLDISQYDLILGSANNNVGTVQVPVELEGLENQFFIADDRMWVIKSLAPDNGKTIITLNDISWMFARDLLWDDNTTYSTIEECIADTIDTEYINLADTEYDTPYVRVSYSTATAWIKPDTENGLWNLKGYIAKVRRMKNVFLSFSISGNYLDIEIEQKTPTLWKLDFATDVAKMHQETYQKTATAKITVNGTTDYYMFTDGTYSTNPAAGTRIQGEWLQVQVNANEDETDKVEDIFSKNAESMILEFYTTEPVEFYDTVQLRHEGRVVTGTLSLVSISSSDNRRYCKTGDLINTVPEAISVLSERIEKVTKTVERATSGGDIQGDLHVSGDIYEGGVKLDDKFGGNAPTLLWTNLSPTSTFSPQTITLAQDATQFDALLVETQYSITIGNKHLDYIGNSGRYSTIVPRTGTNTTYIIAWRDLVVNGNTIEISQALAKNLTTGGVDNGCAVPMNIWGIQFKGPKGDRGPSGAAPVLLWTNTAPTSSFAAQTVAIDLTGYTMVYIECNTSSNTTTGRTVQMGMVGSEIRMVSAIYQIHRRNAVVSTSGVTFGNNYYLPTYASGTETQSNTYMIPTRIYAI